MPSAAFLRMPSGRFSLKKVRTSSRNAFSSGVKRRSMSCLPLVNLEQPRGAHAAADAHRHDGMLCAAALALDQNMAGHARPAHAERMPNGDRAAVHVQVLLRNAEPVATVEHL